MAIHAMDYHGIRVWHVRAAPLATGARCRSVLRGKALPSMRCSSRPRETGSWQAIYRRIMRFIRRSPRTASSAGGVSARRGGEK
jgi:hypothetical protein